MITISRPIELLSDTWGTRFKACGGAGGNRRFYPLRMWTKLWQNYEQMFGSRGWLGFVRLGAPLT